MLDEKTIYNYIDAGLLSAGNMDLPRKIRFRARKKEKTIRVDKQCHVGRTYDDFLEYIEANPDVPVVEMDSVEGRKGGKVFLTIYFRNCSLMLAFIRDHNTAKSVTDIFNDLYEKLGHAELEKLKTEFPRDYRERIERLSGYIASTGKSYKNHLVCLPIARPARRKHCCSLATLTVLLHRMYWHRSVQNILRNSISVMAHMSISWTGHCIWMRPRHTFMNVMFLMQ